VHVQSAGTPHVNAAREESSKVPGSLWLFDFDNTLARLEPVVDWAASRRELEPMLRDAGVPEPLFQQFPKGNLVLYEACRAHLAETVQRDSAQRAAILLEASAIIEKYELKGVDKAAPLAGAVDILDAITRAGGTVGIVTSNSSRTVRSWLERNAAEKSVQIVVGRDSLLPLKPAPDMILEARKTGEGSAQITTYVGDAPADCAAAKAAGVTFCGIASTQGARDALRRAGATEIFESQAALAIQRNFDFPS
jgi:HAD superfamily hydrolase (TIGR01549 family)